MGSKFILKDRIWKKYLKLQKGEFAIQMEHTMHKASAGSFKKYDDSHGYS